MFSEMKCQILFSESGYVLKLMLFKVDGLQSNAVQANCLYEQ